MTQVAGQAVADTLVPLTEVASQLGGYWAAWRAFYTGSLGGEKRGRIIYVDPERVAAFTTAMRATPNGRLQ